MSGENDHLPGLIGLGQASGDICRAAMPATEKVRLGNAVVRRFSKATAVGI
jgi:hypothetical protein